MSEGAIRYRIKNLEARGIILGYRALIDLNVLGYQYNKIHFLMKNYDSKLFNQFLNYVHVHPNSVYTTEVVGSSNVEVEFQVKNNTEIYMILDTIRSMFREIIQDFYFMEYCEEYKFSYLP